MVERVSWDRYFLNIAKEVSTRATCSRASVGAVLVQGNRILTTGYNGAPPGMRHCDHDNITGGGGDVVDNHCTVAIHAEVNAVAQAAAIGVSVHRATCYLYDTLYRGQNCRNCTQILLAAGIDIVKRLDEKGMVVHLYLPDLY